MDVITRYLRYLGYKVRYVQNITDVGHILDSGEDRIMKGARRERIEPMELVETYTRSYFEDMDALRVVRPNISPRASGHITEQIEIVNKLLEKGYAYETVTGDVYFSVEKLDDYGKLSGHKVEEQEAGVRVAVREEKRHPADFALWKRAELRGDGATRVGTSNVRRCRPSIWERLLTFTVVGWTIFFRTTNAKLPNRRLPLVSPLLVTGCLPAP
jgi:cysteinyl-tRNA synthetase